MEENNVDWELSENAGDIYIVWSIDGFISLQLY